MVFPETCTDDDIRYGHREADPLTEAIAFEQWIAVSGLTEAELGERIGQPCAYIQQRRALLRAAIARIEQEIGPE
jgi:hypothetical protein